jgi:PAS domain S-box-containing protein
MQAQEKFKELRREAEKILREKTGGSPTVEVANIAEHDFVRLIHELEVHQIELELQNEELREANRQVQESRDQFEQLYNSAPVGYVTLDRNGMIIRANATAARLLQTPIERLTLSGFSSFIHSDDHNSYFGLIKEMVISRDNHGSCEVRLLRAKKIPFFVHLEISPIQIERKELLGWRIVFTDIGKRKEAEQKLADAYETLQASEQDLHQLSARLLQVQEDERKRIARELHDSIGQILVALKFSVENALKAIKRGGHEPVLEVLNLLVPNIQKAIEETRSIYMGLRPTLLDDLGVLVAIDWLCRNFQASYPKIHIEVEKGIDEGEIPEDLKIVIFRIIQEIMNNVAKHSQAELVNISLGRVDNRIELVVEDHGEGFNSDANRAAGPGLSSMKERAELSGGCLSISSRVGEGTFVRATWPCDR